MPVYNKPMIYYSLSILMLCKFREVILICDRDSKKIYEKIFSNGKHLGMKIHIVVQEKANGIPEAFLISKKFSFLQWIGITIHAFVFISTDSL